MKPGESIRLKRSATYWGLNLPENIGRYNFDRITYRTVPDQNMEFEVFKKGEIDYFYFLMAKMWEQETDSVAFRHHYIQKLKATNLLPYATQGIAWNLRRPLFQDRDTRVALSLLMNRKKLISDLFFNNYVPSSGIVPVTSEYHSPLNSPLPYDPARAKALLQAAGWLPGGDGLLVKNGRRFEFELITDNSNALRYLTVFQEAFLKAGIKMNLRVIDWSTRLKARRRGKFRRRRCFSHPRTYPLRFL